MTKSTAQDQLRRAVLSSREDGWRRLLVAVSGGPDSVALLRTLSGMSHEHGWQLRLGHVHHGLRGSDADADADFVVNLAEALHLECDVVRVDTAGHARTGRLSIEAAARELRYAALESMAQRWTGAILLTGHTLDDQAETLLLNLLRGSGLDGLGAMKARLETPVRPFLTMRRSTVLQALNEWGQPYRCDFSNADLRFRRNRVRADVVPLLEAIQPGAAETLARTARLLSEDAILVADEVTRLLPSLQVTSTTHAVSASLPVWRALRPALRRHVLRRMIGMLLGNTRDVEARHLESIDSRLDDAGFSLLAGQLPHGMLVWSDGERFELRREPAEEKAQAFEVSLTIPGQVVTPVGIVSVEVLDSVNDDERERLLVVCGPHHAFLDAELLVLGLRVRSGQPGDRMQPLGMKGTRKLQDLFVDRKFPRSQRHNHPVLVAENRIVWVPGIAVSETARLTAQTIRVAHLQYHPL